MHEASDSLLEAFEGLHADCDVVQCQPLEKYLPVRIIAVVLYFVRHINYPMITCHLHLQLQQ